MKVSGYRPTNSFLHRPLDRRWRQWLSRCAAGAAVLSVTLGAFVGPRQATVRLRYEIARLRTEVAALEREHRQLVLEREALSSPGTLSRDFAVLGLEIVPRSRVAYLDAAGRLTPAPVAAPKTAPTPSRPSNREERR